MRILNFKAKKFIVGRNVIITSTFITGNIILAIGEIGKIIGESRLSLPDMGLFNLRILDLEFKTFALSVGETVAEKYMKMI